MSCSPALQAQGTLPRCLLLGAHRSGRNDSLAHTLCALADANREWISRRSPGDRRAEAPTRTAWRGPERRPEQMAFREMDAPEPAVIPGSTQPPRAKLLPDTPLGAWAEKGLYSVGPSPGCQPQQVPAHRGWAGRQDPRSPHL